MDVHAGRCVAGNDIARTCRRAADGVGRTLRDVDAISTIAQGQRSGNIGADEVAHNQRSRLGRRPSRGSKVNPVHRVTGDDVARARSSSADGGVGGVEQLNAVAAIGQCHGASGIRPDAIALDNIAILDTGIDDAISRASKLNAINSVSRNRIRCNGRGGNSPCQVNSMAAVSQGKP